MVVFKDTEVINRLYLIVFQKMKEILKDIEKIVPFDATKSERPKYLQAYLRFHPGEFREMILYFQKCGLGEEFDTLMDPIWKINHSIIPHEMPKDWKQARKIIEQLSPS